MVVTNWSLDDQENITIAIQRNDEERVRGLLLKKKGTKTFFSDNDMSPLHAAVEFNKSAMMDIVLNFLEMDVNTTYCGATSLFKASYKRTPCIEIISKLLAHKADVNQGDDEDRTPLMMASKNGNVQIMNLLIEAGANIDAVDNKNHTAVIQALGNKSNNSDGLNLLLFYNAKLYIPSCPEYNPLAYAIRYNLEYVDALIPYCKIEENFSDALRGAILANRADIYQKLIRNGAKLPVCDLNYLLNLVISTENLADRFYLVWSINNVYLDPKSFALVFYKIFQERTRVSFFKSCLKIIINTPDLKCNFTGDGDRLVISTIFAPNPEKNYDWNLCKDILLDFCEFINRLGIKLKNYDLIIFVKYFQGNCQFITELLSIFIKYDPNLVTIHDVMYFSRFNDLNIASYLLHHCSDFSLIFPRSIYEHYNLNEFSEDMLKFFLQQFTPTKLDTANIRSFEKFDNINIEHLEVPTLREIARNALRKTMKNSELKKLIQDLNIKLDYVDILYFKTSVNHV